MVPQDTLLGQVAFYKNNGGQDVVKIKGTPLPESSGLVGSGPAVFQLSDTPTDPGGDPGSGEYTLTIQKLQENIQVAANEETFNGNNDDKTLNHNLGSADFAVWRIGSGVYTEYDSEYNNRLIQLNEDGTRGVYTDIKVDYDENNYRIKNSNGEFAPFSDGTDGGLPCIHTDLNGTANILGLLPGRYRIKELKEPVNGASQVGLEGYGKEAETVGDFIIDESEAREIDLPGDEANNDFRGEWVPDVKGGIVYNYDETSAGLRIVKKYDNGNGEQKLGEGKFTIQLEQVSPREGEQRVSAEYAGRFLKSTALRRKLY